MADQLLDQAAISPASAATPQLQRTVYHKSDGSPRDGSPSCAESAVDMEQYYQPLERFHSSSLHGWGIAAGLHVAVASNQAGVSVQPGIAVDSNGLHIFLVSGGQVDISPSEPEPIPTPPVSPGTLNPVAVRDDGVTVPTTNLTGDQYLVIHFGERPIDDTPTFSIHTPWLHFVSPANLPQDGSCIPLAKVTLDNTGHILTLTQDVRQRVDRHVERAQDVSVHGPGVVAGLDVLVTLNSAGVTVLPGLALDGTGQYISLSSGGQAEIGATADTPGAIPNLVNVPTTGVVLPTAGLTGDKYLTIQFWETPVRVSLPLPPTRDQVAPYRFVYTPWLRLVDTTGFTSDDLRVVLAKITFGTGANVGLVTNLTQDLRQSANLGIGGIHLLKSTSAAPSVNSQLVSTSEAGSLQPITNGLALTVPNANDEIHLNAANVVTNGTLTANNSLIANGNITANSSLAVAGPITANSSLIANGNITARNALTVSGPITASGNVAIGLTSPRTPLHVLGRISSGQDFTSAGAMTFFPPDGFAWFHIDNGPAGGRPLGRLRFSHGPNPGDHEIMNIDQGGNVRVLGNFFVSGQKSFIQEHPTDATKQIVYVSLEGGEAGTYIRGTGTLIDGEAVIELPKHFGLVTHEQGLTIQLTPRGAWLQLYAGELSTERIVVHEAQGKNGEFDYFIQGIREGHENHQVIQEKV